jgi:hypothetical protein
MEFVMTEDEKLAKEKADAARADAEGPEWAKNLSSKMDACMSKMDSGMARMDACESMIKDDAKRRADAAEPGDEEKAAEAAKAAETAADKKKADEAEAKAKEEEAKADAARADAAVARIAGKETPEQKAARKADKKAAKVAEDAARADAVTKAVEAAVAPFKTELQSLKGAVHISPADKDALAAIQARADEAACLFAEKAPGALVGETAIDYRKRLAAKYKAHSPKWKDADLNALNDSILSIAEGDIYADAKAAAAQPAEASAGKLYPVVHEDQTGRKITEWKGDKSVWMDQFKASGYRQLMINNSSAVAK